MPSQRPSRPGRATPSRPSPDGRQIPGLLVLGFSMLMVGTIIPRLAAQVATLSPEEPRWGTPLEISYDPKAPAAKFTPRDLVFASIYIYREDGGRPMTAPLVLRDGTFRHTLNVEDGTSYIAVRFITLQGWDRRVSLETMVYRPDGKPARGAYGRSLFAAGPQEYRDAFDQEIELYPDHYAAYRDKWFAASAFEKDKLEEIVREDMARLESVEGEPIGLTYSRSYGHLLLGQEPEGRALLIRLLEGHPTSNLARLALSSYEYQVFAQQIEGEGPKAIETLKRATIREHPGSELARAEIYKLVGDAEFPLEVTEAVCRPWLAEQPKNPEPYLHLAAACLEHEAKLDEALGLADASIERLLAGELRLIDDVSGGRSGFFLPYAYRVAADIARRQKKYARAVAYAKAARELSTRSQPRYPELEGEIWEEIGDPGRAETAYVDAWKAGSKTARSSLEKLFVRRTGAADGFSEYLKELEGKDEDDEGTLAPAFAVTSLGGEKLELASLRGKVVVLNFWFIGCAPCRVEIPGLNELVHDYRDRDVVFIAFANDPEEDLRSFLKKKPFDYQVVPLGSKIAGLYGVSGYPTHVIIDPKGRVAVTLTGGSKTRHEDLRPVIDRLLGAP